MVAERAVHQGERHHERGHLEHIGKNGAHGRCSEPLRLDEGEDEIAQQGHGHEQADDVLGAHSFATALVMRATSANTATVVRTKARSAIACS
ncbi:hypothetical protein GCM10023237_61380 [Streptomyces coeruleoprunus]